jgi:adenosylcobinamide kinase/adenosylcobinamide-phosphate guanylyltransferase
MRHRIDKHKANRPLDWQTIEASSNISSHLRNLPGNRQVVIIDCWSFYIANLCNHDNLDGTDEENIDPDVYRDLEKIILHETDLLIDSINEMSGDFIIVSNEVGLGLVPPYPLGRCYRDLLGLSHQRITGRAAKIYFMIAGIPMELKRAL